MDLQKLQTTFPNLEFKQDVILAPFTYMKVGGPAKLFIEVRTQDDLFSLSSFCYTENIPFVVLGGASNVIVPDAGIDTLVIRNLTNAISIEKSETERVAVHCDSGVITAILANKTMEENLTGLEHFVGVPGTIGGAIYNNSHFTAHELVGNHIQSVTVCTDKGQKEVWTQDKLEFGYDYSVFHVTNAVILSATFILYKGDQAHIREHVRQSAMKRTQTQPIGVPSSGCMYKNPSLTEAQLFELQRILEIPEGAIKKINEERYNVAAGFLIDRAGLKGTTVGGAQVSSKHATFLINTGNATSTDVEQLCQKVEYTVREKFGIELQREVFFL